MDIDVPLRSLGSIDSTDLREVIFDQEDAAWYEDESRQKRYYMHDQTRSIVLLALDDTKWPDRRVSKGPGWERLAEVAVPLMENIIKNNYPIGGDVIRAVVASLKAGKNIKAHTDGHPSFHCAHRIHVPVSTNPKVWFTIGGKPHQFKVGEAYEINNMKQHSVVNKGDEDRLTFIFDYIPPDRLADPTDTQD
jgi:quercetin dioxygenase-like cupin family protein